MSCKQLTIMTLYYSVVAYYQYNDNDIMAWHEWNVYTWQCMIRMIGLARLGPMRGQPNAGHDRS